MAKKKSTSRKRSRPVSQKKNKLDKNVLILAGLGVVIVVAVAGILLIGGWGDNGNDIVDDNGIVGDGNPIAVIDTTMGTIKVELYEDKVPITAGNFKNLANDGFYDGTKIHRISPNFMIQGGCPNSKDDDPSDDGTGGPGYAIEDEFHDDLKNERGMISMANSGPNTGGSQFFILVRDATWLDGAHAVFGKVIDGMNVVDAIAEAENDGRYEPNPGGGRPVTDIVVNSITIE